MFADAPHLGEEVLGGTEVDSFDQRSAFAFAIAIDAMI